MLDTNILIHWDRLERSVLPRQVAIGAITLAELAAAVHAVRADDALERARRVDLLQRVEGTFDPISFDAAAARAFGRVAAAVRNRGRSPRSRLADLMIAATAVAHEIPLYTTNSDDFEGLSDLLAVVAVERPR